MMPAWRRYFSSLAARLRSRRVAAPVYSSSSSTRRLSRAASRSAASSSSLALAAIFLLTPRSYLSRRSPRESRMGRSASPLVVFAFLGLAPSCVTESTSLVRFLFSSSSATSTRSATSSPKSPTCESELTDRVVAFWRLRSTLERGTRVNRSSSILARASMRANSRLAKALCMSPSSPPSSSGASPSSCASSLMREERCALLLASFSARFCLELLPPSSKSSMAVGINLGGRYTPPSAPSSASSSTLLTSASGLGLNCRGSSLAPSASSSSPVTPSFAILRSLSIWYLSFLSMGLSFSM
mmetsp:Transcript_6045/g.24980  ORF Transcript_6045/g.24980 Transcript_6045/m.24980 type:complete len:299 (+) Transcript_6045:1827-2723(+)